MHSAVAYSHHPNGYPAFLSYAPTAQRKSDCGMSLHHPHHYLNDSIGGNTSSSPSSNNSSAHLLSYSGYSTGLDLSSHTNNHKRTQSDIDDDDENNNDDSQQSASPSTSVLGDITSTANGQKKFFIILNKIIHQMICAHHYHLKNVHELFHLNKKIQLIMKNDNGIMNPLNVHVMHVVLKNNKHKIV